MTRSSQFAVCEVPNRTGGEFYLRISRELSTVQSFCGIEYFPCSKAVDMHARSIVNVSSLRVNFTTCPLEMFIGPLKTNSFVGNFAT